jgi:hypothetical protein
MTQPDQWYSATSLQKLSGGTGSENGSPDEKKPGVGQMDLPPMCNNHGTPLSAHGLAK